MLREIVCNIIQTYYLETRECEVIVFVPVATSTRVCIDIPLTENAKEYLSKKEEMNEYDWRYYFVKYPDMLRGADGELTWDESNQYICTTLNKHQFNGQHWNPFLNVIYKMLSDELQDKDGKRLIALENYGENLNILKPISSLAATGTGFIYYHQDTNDVWDVEQENSIDKVDRIAFAIAKIKKLVQENMSV
jgi:hypothetical protein